MRRPWALPIAVLLLLAACKSDPAPATPQADASPDAAEVAAPPGPASVRFLHAAPELGTVQLRMDVDLIGPAGDAAAMPEAVPTFDAPPGERTFQVEVHADKKATSLARLEVKLEGDRRYLLLLTGEPQKGTTRLTLLPDDQAGEATDKEALVRVVNAAEAGAFDVYLKPGWAFPNVGSRKATAYLPRTAAKVALSAAAGLDADAAPVYQMENVDLQPSHRYVVVLTSKLTAAGDKKVTWLVTEAPTAPEAEEAP